ncbi:MAG: prolipoprotein diacylglyceryl transferase [Chloroflexota bacterium]|mgnify:FL=1
MIEINLDPKLFALGPLLITWHGFFSAVGLAAGIWLIIRMVRGSGVTADDVYAVAMPAVVGGIVGARVLFVLENLQLFAERPLGVFAINEGGISIYGAVIGGSLAAWVYARFTGRPVAYLADRTAIGLIIGQGIGRIGDIINGEHHGSPAPGFPFSVTYTHPATLGELGVPAHLAVGYELLLDLLLGGALYLLLKRQPRNGLVYVAYIFFYGLVRLLVGFYRQDVIVLAASPTGEIGLGMAQALGVISMVVAVPWYLWLIRQPQRAERPAAPPPVPQASA